MKLLKLFPAIIFLLLINSCGLKNKSTIEVFQRLDTYRDMELLDEMEREAATVKTINFKFNVAVSTDEQIAQIRKAIENGASAIIVDPSDIKRLVPIIEEAYDAGVFVILVRKKVQTFKYHAFSGTDEMSLGRKAAKYVNKLLNGHGNIIIVNSFRSSKRNTKEYESFIHTLEQSPEIRIVGEIQGANDNENMHKSLDSLKTSLHTTHVDLIYSFEYFKELGTILSQLYPNAIFIGSDGAPRECYEAMQDGILQAGYFNPAGGKEAVNAAICLIKGLPYKKDNYIQSALVSSENSEVLELNNNIFKNYEQKIDLLLNERENREKSLQLHQFIAIATSALFLLFLALFLIVLYRLKTTNTRLIESEAKAKQFESMYNEMEIKKEVAEKMKMELELDREGLIEAGLSIKDEEHNDVVLEAVFMKSFRDIAEKHIDDAEYTIDELAAELGVSRAQLFRKIKKESGSTPNDLFQSMRLEKAKEMIREGVLNISEISNAVGFTSPSYFSKCYKDKFGTAPSSNSNNRKQ